MRINTNVAALNSYNQLKNTQNNLSKSLSRLSSGKRINGAADDAAGLAISEKMGSQTRGLAQAQRNAQDGISMIQTAEGALKESHSILQRMRELAVQSANDTNTSDDRSEIQREIDQLNSELGRISNTTEFNTKKLLNGNMGKTYAVTGNDFALDDVKITGSDISDGTYNLKLTNTGTDTASINTNTAASSLGATNVSAADGTKYGSYKLDVTRSGGTMDVTLTGPNGEQTSKSGEAIDSDLTIGGMTFAFGTNAVNVADGNSGTIEFDYTANNLQVDLTGDKSVTTTQISAYAGEKLNVGGFEFTVDVNSSSANDEYNMNVTDNAVKFQIGANEDQNTDLSINDMSHTALGVSNIDVTNQAGANSAISTIDDAISTVSSERSKLGAVQNRLDHTINNLNTAEENLTAAESRISDVDMAKEMMNFTKSQILSQAGTAMMAQANQLPQGVLQLLG